METLNLGTSSGELLDAALVLRDACDRSTQRRIAPDAVQYDFWRDDELIGSATFLSGKVAHVIHYKALEEADK